MRLNALPRALNGQPFQTADARALGVSWKTLQGSRFRRIAKGIYVDAASTDSYRLQVRGVMLALPPGTIAIGVTGLQLLGVDIGCPLPMIFATIHQRQVRRRDVKVMRVKELPPHRDGIASPEHCWLVAASTLDLLDLVSRRRFAAAAAANHPCPPTVVGPQLLGTRCRRRPYRGEAGTGTCGLAARDLAATVLVLAGLPIPECNLIIGDDQGPIGRVDLVYIAYKLIVEYEGDQHRTDRNQWNRDIDRHEDFARDHWTLIRVTSERARWPRQVVRGVYEALRANGYQGPPPQFSELWMCLFE
jgi:hypothetical protein